MLLARAPVLGLKSLKPPKCRLPTRTLSTAPARSRLFTTRRLAAAGIITAATGASLYARSHGPIYADAEDRGGTIAAGTQVQAPLSELVRTYVVYSLCSIPALVDWSPAILSTLSSVPGLKQITEAIVRITFFDQARLVPLLCVRDLMADVRCSS